MHKKGDQLSHARSDFCDYCAFPPPPKKKRRKNKNKTKQKTKTIVYGLFGVSKKYLWKHVNQFCLYSPSVIVWSSLFCFCFVLFWFCFVLFCFVLFCFCLFNVYDVQSTSNVSSVFKNELGNFKMRCKIAIRKKNILCPCYDFWTIRKPNYRTDFFFFFWQSITIDSQSHYQIIWLPRTSSTRIECLNQLIPMIWQMIVKSPWIGSLELKICLEILFFKS